MATNLLQVVDYGGGSGLWHVAVAKLVGGEQEEVLSLVHIA